MIEIEELSDEKLIETYGVVINELKKRKIIRSKNLLGDLKKVPVPLCAKA